jgi:hypothetical protein
MSAPRCRVRRYWIHGAGVFATRRIRAGTRIIEYRGERVTHAEADRRYAASTLVGGRIDLRALRTIQSGEELHDDFRIERARSDPPDIDRLCACRCGVPACRGTLLRPRRTRAGRAARQRVATAAHHPHPRAPRERRARA